MVADDVKVTEEKMMKHRLHCVARRPRSVAMLVAGLALASCASPGDRPAVDRLPAGTVIVDTHIDAPIVIESKGVDLSQRSESGQFDLDRARTGRLGVAFMSIFVPASEDEAGRGRALADRLIDHVEALAARSGGQAAVVYCVDEARRVARSGRLALALGMENGGPLAEGPDALEHFAARGVRYVTLAHSKANAFADAAYSPERPWGGLSPAGEALVRRLNAAGVMVDVSHLSDAAVEDVLRIATAPVIASHSATRHFTPGFERNLGDEMIRAIAATGGVVQINFGSTFVTADAQTWSARRQTAFAAFQESTGAGMDSPAAAAFMAEYAQRDPLPRATLDDVLDHFDHVASLVGTTHVGIGSDFDGVGDTLPTGLEDVSRYPDLALGLAARGYRPSEVRNMLGGNLLRVWAKVEQRAAAQGAPRPCGGAGRVGERGVLKN
jgi:membrane dipeptidase